MEVGARGWAALAPNGATDTVTSVYWGWLVLRLTLMQMQGMPISISLYPAHTE